MNNVYTLRDYQQPAVDAAVAYLQNPRMLGRNGLIVAPTGAGKSLYIASIVTRLGQPAVILQPSKEILEQNLEKLAHYGYRGAVFSASLGRRERGTITLATIGSVVQHADAFSHYPYVLIDECHAAVNPKGGQYMDFLECLRARVLGLTATPFRLASNSLGSQLRFLTRTRPRIFRDVVHITQIQELVGRYWTPLVYQDVGGFDRTKVRRNSSGADYEDGSVQQYLVETGFVGRLVDQVRALLNQGRRHILVYTRFVDESVRLARAMPGVVEVVTAETPPRERERILAAFKAGTVKVVANVGVLTLGFDFPALDTVVLARPTISLALYYQMIGRAVRQHPGKLSALIVDMVQLRDQFGRVEDLVIKPGGSSGEQWAVYASQRALTNVYFEAPDVPLTPSQKRQKFFAKKTRMQPWWRKRRA